MPAASLRLEAYAEEQPEKRVLLSVSADAPLDELREAVQARLGLDAPPDHLCLGESEARIVDPSDLRDGDIVRAVVGAAAALPSSSTERSTTSEQPRVRFAPGSDGAARRARSWRDSPAWFEVQKAILTLVICVVLYQAFEWFVFVPYFRPDRLDDGERGLPPIVD